MTRRDQWTRGFAAAVAAINAASAETHDALIVAVVTQNCVSLNDINRHADSADAEVIQAAFTAMERR